MSKEISVEEKLRALYDLQLIDSRIDAIRTLRGELPFEVQDLEDEIAGLETRLAKINDELKEMEAEVKEKKQFIKTCQDNIKKYEEQQKNVRNNREFEAINREMEFQELEIQLTKKRIKEAEVRMDAKKALADEAKARMAERNSHLEFKRGELNEIITETQKEEEVLGKKSAEFSAKLEERLLSAYNRIRHRVNNGLAVVPIERGAAAGSFFVIPPQKQMEVAQRKKIIIDEHSGRILVDPILAEEESARIQEIISKLV
jgi:predicted  nucleic acid-binding Zn-ribbon protein